MRERERERERDRERESLAVHAALTHQNMSLCG